MRQREKRPCTQNSVFAFVASLFLASSLAFGQASGTEYVSFWSGDLRIFANEDDTTVELIDIDTGLPLSMVDVRISSTNFGTNPFTLASAGDSFGRWGLRER